MSSIVTTGKEEPNSLPVLMFIEFGPVDPLQPPITLLQITKYLSVFFANSAIFTVALLLISSVQLEFKFPIGSLLNAAK